MERTWYPRGLVWIVVAMLLTAAHPCSGRGNRDIMYDDADTPKQPGCENSFVLVSFRSGVVSSAGVRICENSSGGADSKLE